MGHILVIGGNTGREFSVIKKISTLPGCSVSAYQWASNRIASELTKNYAVGDVRDIKNIASFVKKTKPNFVFIGQGESIEAGVVDKIEELGYPCAAPKMAFSKLESQKKFSLELVKNINPALIPETQTLSTFDIKKITKFINEFGPKIVVKLDAKINSRGVHIFDMKVDSVVNVKTFCEEWLHHGGEIILQEFIEGDEFSIVTYTDGHRFFHSPITQNYKPVFNNNQGAQTSGMGSATWRNEENIPSLPKKTIDTAKKLNEKVLHQLQNQYGTTYKGALFGEYLVTPTGKIKFIEYNVRFGNPCSINHFNLLDGSLFEFLHAIANEKLSSFKGSWLNKNSLTAYAVPKNYPYTKEHIGLSVDLSKIPEDVLYYAFMDYTSKETKMLFSRLFAIGLIGENLQTLNKKINSIMNLCKGPIHWRNDIGIV